MSSSSSSTSIDCSWFGQKRGCAEIKKCGELMFLQQLQERREICIYIYIYICVLSMSRLPQSLFWMGSVSRCLQSYLWTRWCHFPSTLPPCAQTIHLSALVMLAWYSNGLPTYEIVIFRTLSRIFSLSWASLNTQIHKRAHNFMHATSINIFILV